MAGSDFVFSTNGKKTAISGWSKAKGLIDIKAAEAGERELEPWRLHDLRRTVATALQRLGSSLQAIEAGQATARNIAALLVDSHLRLCQNRGHVDRIAFVQTLGGC